MTTPVVVESAQFRAWDADLEDLAGPSFARNATDPIAVEVLVERAIDPIPRASRPLILLNGDELRSTTLLPADPEGRTLIAFIEDQGVLPTENEVEVYWTGHEEQTRSEQAVTVAPLR